MTATKAINRNIDPGILLSGALVFRAPILPFLAWAVKIREVKKLSVGFSKVKY